MGMTPMEMWLADGAGSSKAQAPPAQNTRVSRSSPLEEAPPSEDGCTELEAPSLLDDHHTRPKLDEISQNFRLPSHEPCGVEDRAVVQFGRAISYAIEGQSTHQVEIMRLGGLQGECSADYETLASEVVGKKVEEIRGTVTFKTGQISEKIELKLLDNDNYEGTVEVVLRLTHPKNCSLGIYLNQTRVKIADDDFFPTNKHRERLGECLNANDDSDWSQDINFSLLIEFGKYAYTQTTRGARKLLLADQINNLVFISQLLLMRLVDNGISQTDPDKRISHELLATYALFLLLPYGITHYLTYRQQFWGVGGGVRKAVLEGLISRFLYYSEESRSRLDNYGFMRTFSIETFLIVSSGYRNFFKVAAAVGRIVLVFCFMGYVATRHAIDEESPILFVTLAPFFLLPPVIGIYISLRAKNTAKVRTRAENAKIQLDDYLGDCVQNYRMIADYWSIPKASTDCVARIKTVNESLIMQGARQANDEAFFGWLIYTVQFLVVIVCGVFVIQDTMAIGTFVAVRSGLVSASAQFQQLYLIMMEMQSTFPCLRHLVEYMNWHTDLSRRTKILEGSWEEFLKCCEELEDRPISGTIVQDKVELRLQNVTFRYGAQDAMPRCRAPVSPADAIDARDLLLQTDTIADATISMQQGQLIAITGASASGKRTLCGLLSGVLLPTKGKILVPPHLRVLLVQFSESLPDMSLAENLFFGELAGKRKGHISELSPEAGERGLKICEELGISDQVVEMIRRQLTESRAGSKRSSNDALLQNINESNTAREIARNISATTRLKIQMARALIADPEVLVLYKPLQYYSWQEGDAIMALLRRFVDERGLGNDPHWGGKRPRTCILTVNTPRFLKHVDKILRLEGTTLGEMSNDSIAGIPVGEEAEQA